MIVIKNNITTKKVVEIKNTSNQTFGGYKTFYHLFLKSIKMLKDINKLNPISFSNLLLQCLFKPLKQFYSYTIKIEGKYEIINKTEFNNINVIKTKYYKLFKFTLLSVNQKLTNEDIVELLK